MATNTQSSPAESGASSWTLKEAFAAFSKFGNSKSDGSTITLSQADKWMKQAGVIGKTITTTDTGIAFNKFKTKAMDFKTFEKYVEDLSNSKKLDPGETKNKLTKCGKPGIAGATKPVESAAVKRLTDTTKYTGAHKERFDEAGKGKGKEGRVNLVDNSGYVAGYKEKDTYDKTH